MINYLLTLFWVKRVNWFNCIYMKVLQFNLLPIEKQGSAVATKRQIKTCFEALIFFFKWWIGIFGLRLDWFLNCKTLILPRLTVVWLRVTKPCLNVDKPFSYNLQCVTYNHFGLDFQNICCRYVSFLYS